MLVHTLYCCDENISNTDRDGIVVDQIARVELVVCCLHSGHDQAYPGH